MKFAFKNWKFIFYRLLPVVYRPAVVLIEYKFSGTNVYLLPILMPMAMLVLSFTTIPSYIPLYRRGISNLPLVKSTELELYSNSILSLLIMVLLVTGLYAKTVGFVHLELLMIFFLIEKLSDEISRYYEYVKKFNTWFLIQSQRTLWVLFPIIFSLFNYRYYDTLLLFGVINVITLVIMFIRIFQVETFCFVSGLKQNVTYLTKGVVSYLGGGYRNLPRLFVGIYFNEISSIYLSISQVVQSLSLIYNIRLQVPYRMMIAKHPVLFFKKIEKITSMLQVLSIASALLGITTYLVLINCKFRINVDSSLVSVLPLLVSETISYSIFAGLLGALQWKCNSVYLLFTSFLCVLIYVLVFVIINQLFDIHSSIIYITMISSISGILYTYIMKIRLYKYEY